jgi:hypothetical protein
MKNPKAKPESEAKTLVRWIPVLDIQSLSTVKTIEDIVAIIKASQAKTASRRPPRRIPVFTAEEAAQIRITGDADTSSSPKGTTSASDSPPEAPDQPAK